MSSRQKGQNKRAHDHLSSCIYRVGVLGGRCQHWSEGIGRENTDARDQKNKQERVVDGVETRAGIFVRNTSFDE